MRRLTSHTSLATMVLGAVLATQAFANPQDGVVSAGAANISSAGTTLTVNQSSDKAVIDWRTFNIAPNELTQFIQPNSSSLTLNRVSAGNPSQILGSLTANGNIILVNPSGIMFGSNAKVDVSGLVATTSNISNSNFMSGNMKFDQPGDVHAQIVNNGLISAKDAGLVGLVAPEVINNGIITAKLGKVQLASGDQFTLDMYGDGLMDVAASGAVQSELIKNSGTINAEGGVIALTAAQGANVVSSLISVEGEIAAPSVSQKGGKIIISGDTISNTGKIDVSGNSAGEVAINGRAIMQQGKITADNSAGAGGKVAVNFKEHYLDNESSTISAKGNGGNGGSIAVVGDTHSNAFVSGNYDASSTGAKGGKVAVTAAQGDLKLFGAHVKADGTTGGGTVNIGGEYQGGGTLAHAATTNINFATTLSANALDTGNGGNVITWSDETTKFGGSAFALGGINGGNGGLIEISSKDTLMMAGNAITEASAARGLAGQLLLDPKNITIATGGINGGISNIEFIDPNPDGNLGGFTVLATGNVLRTDQADSFAASNAGAIYLYNGTTGALISTLTGSHANDQIGSSNMVTLTGAHAGNVIVQSGDWANGGTAQAGAVTFINGTTGLSGVISAANSLVGSTTGDMASANMVTLSNGNYLVLNSGWTNGGAANAGAVTWGNGATGTSGVVSNTNSLVGTNTGDAIGSNYSELTNGNYVVSSSAWDNGAVVDAGAVTWGSGIAGVVGNVSAANSLVGSTAGDEVGGYGIRALTNGNYVVLSPFWDNGGTVNAGAATWGNGTTGTVGAVSAANSLYGATANDGVGDAVAVLTNGNYVVRSEGWSDGVHNGAGAITWGNGTTGISGAVSAANSLVGSHTNDFLGDFGIVALNNGNYVVNSPGWDNGATGDAGAVTWGNGLGGTVGVVDATNSLVGSQNNDQVGRGGIFGLTNGNYVVRSTFWSNGGAFEAGAATWANGLGGTVGAVSAANSIVGTHTFDHVGQGDIYALANGNYVFSSVHWNSDRGAVTWGNGAGGTVGALGAGNSLIGSTANDNVGLYLDLIGNNNYVVRSTNWDNGGIVDAGAVTWGDGSTGTFGVVSAANSLVGSQAFDAIGNGFSLLTNGNYVIQSTNWDNGGFADAGAATWGSKSGGHPVGAIDATNSVIGTHTNDRVGYNYELANGNYLLVSTDWNNGAGMVMWGDGANGTVGTISSANAIVGSTAGDGINGIQYAPNKILVFSSTWDNGATADVGVLGFFDGAAMISGALDATNSFMGTNANDQITYYTSDSVNSRVLAYDGGPQQHVWSVGTGGSLGNYDSYGDQATGSVTLAPAFITAVLNAGTNVTLQASNDITLTDALIANNPGGNGGILTFQAGRSIFLNNDITTDNGNLNIFANEKLATGVVDAQRTAGAAVITMASGTTIDTGTGDLNIRLDDGAGKTNSTAGDITLAGTINANTITVNNKNTTGDVVLATGADLNAAANSGDSMILSSRRNFLNQVGAGVLSMNGTARSLIYSTAPGSDSVNGLTAAFTRYSCTFGGACPALGAGNGFLYSSADPSAPVVNNNNNTTTTPNTVLYVSQTPVPNIITSPLLATTVDDTDSNDGKTLADIRDNKSRPGLWDQRTRARLINLQDWLSIDPDLVREFALDYTQI